jgi:hypothetical protein
VSVLGGEYRSPVSDSREILRSSRPPRNRTCEFCIRFRHLSACRVSAACLGVRRGMAPAVDENSDIVSGCEAQRWCCRADLGRRLTPPCLPRSDHPAVELWTRLPPRATERSARRTIKNSAATKRNRFQSESVGFQSLSLRQQPQRQLSLAPLKARKSADKRAHPGRKLLTAEAVWRVDSSLFRPVFSKAPDFVSLVRIS